MSKKYTYFWRFQSPFSQHHAVKFNVDNQEFNCAEQYYMYKKACTFEDYSSAEKILRTKNPTQQKSLGRKVKKFNQNIWNKISTDVVYNGNFNKFTQNKNLMNLLLATDGTTLVEASPKDHIWGVGLDASDSRILNDENWLGQNKLGYILSKLRQDFFIKGYKYDENIYTLEKNDSNLFFSEISSPFHPKHMTLFLIDNNNFCSLHQYLSFMLSNIPNKKNGPIITDHKNLFYGSANPKFLYHLLVGNYYKFNQNLNVKAQLLDTAGRFIIFIDADTIIGTKWPSGKKETAGKNLLGRSLTVLRDLFLEHGRDLTVEKFLHEFEIIEKVKIAREFKQISKKPTSAKKNKRSLIQDTSLGVSSKKIKTESDSDITPDTSLEWVESNLQVKSNVAEKSVGQKRESHDKSKAKKHLAKYKREPNLQCSNDASEKKCTSKNEKKKIKKN